MMTVNKKANMNENFNRNVNTSKSKIFLLILPLFIIVGLAIFIFGLGNRTLHCTYTGVNGYNCQTNLKILGFDLGTDNFQNITKAVMASSRGSKGTNYQMQFENQNGQKFRYTGVWTGSYNSVNKEIKAVNKFFEAGQNFNYNFAREWFMIIFGLFFAGLPMLMLIFSLRATSDDTGFGNFDAQKFMKKDLSKMSDAEVLAFIKQKDEMEK